MYAGFKDQLSDIKPFLKRPNICLASYLQNAHSTIWQSGITEMFLPKQNISVQELHGRTQL